MLEEGPVLVVIFYVTLASRLSLSDSSKDYNFYFQYCAFFLQYRNEF